MADHRVEWEKEFPTACRSGVVTIGNFDGVHRGHAALIAEMRRRAATLPGPAVALTFDPHPLEMLRPTVSQPALTTTTERIRLLHEIGADEVVILRTTPGLLALSAADFFNRVVRERLAARELVEGVNFGFGRKREGNVETLTRLCRDVGMKLTVVPPVTVDGVEVSSSRIRAALLRGDVTSAAALLGRPYRLAGTVVGGAKRGRTIGFPTANLDQLRSLAPGDGVYAVRALVGAETYLAVANVGPNPTFDENARKVEVHLLDFAGDLYDQLLAVDFINRLRDTRPFGSVTELVAQLHRDVGQARAGFGE